METFSPNTYKYAPPTPPFNCYEKFLMILRDKDMPKAVCWKEITASIAAEHSLHSLLEPKPTKTNLIFLPITPTFPALQYNKPEVCPVEQDQGICKPKTHTKKRLILTSPCLLPCYPTAARCPFQPSCCHRTHCHHSAFSGRAQGGQLHLHKTKHLIYWM